MRRWFGVALLGLVAAVVGGITGAILTGTAVATADDHAGANWLLLIGQLFAVVAFLGGLIALMVGLVGAGVKAIRAQ